MSNVHDKNIKLIYDKLTSKGVDMGTLEETTKALRSDPRNGRLLYDMGTKHGYDMGSYEEFEEAMGLPKFQAPLEYGEEPIEVNSAQPKTEEPKQEDDYLTSDMPEEVEPEEEYDFNREVLKDYVPQFKNEIKEKFPNARLYGFTRPMQMSTTGTGGITPNPNYGTPITLTEEEKAQRDSLDYQLKRGQITKEQYADQISAINKQATDRLNDQFSEDTLNASAALHLMNQAQKRVKLVDGRTKSNVVNAFRGVGHFDYAGLNPALQFVDAYRSFALLNKVAENPDAELSESEQYLLQAIVTNNAVNDTFQTTMAERIGQGLPESMAFMAQFALTGGIGSAVGKLAKEGVEKVIKKGLKNATRRLYDDGFKGLAQKGLDRTLNTVIPGVVGATTAAATQTILNPTGLASGTYGRAAGTAEYTLAPDGTPVATGEVTGRMGLGEAFAKEFGAQTIEQLSERAGASLGIVTDAGKAVVKTTGKAIASKTPGVQKAADAFVEFADNMKKTKVGDLVGKAAEWLENKDFGVKALAQKVGWNGTIEEWYEEQANTLLNAMFVGDEELSALFNGERQLETFLSVAVVGGATRLLSAPAAIEQRAEVRKEKQNLKNTISDIEKRVQGNSALSNALKAVATAVDTGTVGDVAIAINEANRQLNLDTDTKRMFLDYASARMMSNMWRSNDRRQASKLAEGVYNEVEARTHKQSGTITVAEYTDKDGNKQNVDIIDGVIIRDGGKKIDSTLSDRSVVVRMQDGTTQMVPSKSLGNIVEEIDPAQYRAKLANASARDMASTFFSEYSARTNKHGVYYNEDGSLDYYHATPAQTALSLIDELGSAEAAAEYAANQLIGLQGAEVTSAEGGEGMSIEAQNALSKWQAVSGLLADITAYNAQQAAAAEGKAPEGTEPMENPLPVDAAAPARNLRTGDRLRLTVDNGEMAEATIGSKTSDGNYLVDFDDTVTIGGKKGVSHELTPEVIAAMQYVEEVQEGDAELQAEQTPEQDDVTSYKDMVIGRIPMKADGSRNWEAATPAEAAQAINAERDGDFDASIAFAQQMAQNCANAVADLANTELEVEDPTNADMVAAAEAQRAQAIASMQKTADFWSEVTNILNTANTERTKPAEQEAPAVEETPTPEDAMPMIDEDTPDFVSAGPERSAEFLSEQFGDDAESFIQDNIAEAQKALADAQGKKPKSTNFAERKKENEAIAQEKVVATAALDFWNAVGAAYAARQSAAPAEEVAQPEVVESAEQPATAAEEQPAEEIATEEKAEENKEVSDVNSEKDTNFVEESEATPQETAEEEITIEMIENTDLDEVIKVMAIDYLNGNVNVATKAAYDAVKNYVRNISTVRPADSTDAGRAQLGEGADDAGSLASGQSRGVSGDLDSREDGGVVSDGDGVRSEAGEDDLAEPSGIGSDNSVGTGGHEPDVVSGIVSSGRVRSGSDSERRPSSRNPQRGKGSSNGVSAQNEGGRGETQRGGDTRNSQEREVKEQEVKDDLARHIQELKDILANPMGEAKGALLDVTSVFGMFGVNAIKVMGATAKIGMDLVKLGYYKFKKWSAAMHENLDGVFHSQTELTDELIDEFIRAMWDTSFKYRGEVRKISEWASLLEAEQLRAMMRMGIEEKRKLQKAAESEPTILGDIENIRKSLPFLLPAQQEDVEKAEFQFFDESHNDAAYGYGKGYMFTNGTGTGKTYTGLGIIKRFIKQGKGRILIVTASGEKIDDWVKDAKNLGITATRLADTKSKGKGVVVTQYANLRQNYELLKDEFDLIVYDESHKLMENQAGEDTNAAAAHYMITNRDAEQAILRTLQDTPLWKEPRQLEEELKELVSLLDAKKLTSEQLKRAEQLGGKVVMEERVSAIRARLTEIAKLQEAEVKKQLQDPNKRAAAEAAVARTKVVFLSATPFNTALNLDYVEGYIFSYPTEEGKERDREKDKERFIMDKFPSSHRRAKQGVVRIDETQIQDADAVTAEEIAFSDYLQNSLHTMSGRGLDSEWDYSREFPKLEVTGARLVNAAIAALTTGKYSALRPYFKHLLDDYAQSTAFFEVIKTSASIERIKEHIALGRKVVVFHRRMSSTEPLVPPFERGLDNADHDDRASAEMIHAFRREFAELLAWEQSLDYRFPQDILMEAFATEEEKAKYQKEQEEYGLKLMNHALGIEKRKPKAPKLRSARVGVFNGNETEAEKHKAVDAFNTDGSECSLLVVQVAAGKEGISLHDKTGKHQRVMMSMQLPQSPIEFVQAEGRIYRVGNKSNAIFEYPVLGIDQEIIGFAAKINGRAATTENLALGSRARGLRNSISRAMLASREIPVSPTQGVGGKQLDSREEWEKTDYDGAIEAYNNRNTESEATTDFNEQDTPEPIGYKMMEWARPEAGESILEPAAGTGTMAQYAPQKSRLTAIEIITKKFATLITKVGGSGRKLLNEDFMGFEKRHKFDCVVMNTPHTGEVAVNALIAPQGVPQKEFEFLDKVFGHINEGGRVVALIEEKSADTTIKAVTNLGKNRVVVGEVKLPAFAFPNANGGTATRVVVFDVVSNEALRSAMPEKVSFDLSGETTPQGLFEAMRDVQMPERTIDKVARLAKKLQKFEAKFKSFKNVVQRGKNYRTGKMEQEVNFDADRAFLSVRTAQGGTYRIGVGGYYFNLYIRGNEIAAGNMGEITNLCNVYKSLKQITDAQTDEEFRYLTRNYEPKTYPEIRDFLEVCKDAIRTALGKTESQIINIAEGRVENELRGELTFKQMKDAFEGLSHGDVTLDDLSKKVFEVVGKIEGLRFYTKSGLPGSTVAYYTPKENAIVINEDTWNSLRLTDGIKAQTVVHEMIHAVTSYYLRQYELGVRFGEEINQACQDIFDVYKAITSDRSFEAGLMQGSKQGDNATYGLTSVQEMIAELANPKFRVQLKLKKLWRQLVNGIKKLLGINLEMGDAQETTALETLENALDTLLSNYDPEYYSQYVGFVNASPNPMEFVEYTIREEAPPTKTGIGYKVFVLKDGKLYPPMVANPNGEATPVGVWLNADAAPIAGQSKTGRSQVKAGGKGTQGGSGKLAYRPGWHLGVIPYALQFNRNDASGERTLFPANFVWAEVEYANDVDYQEEAMSYGVNKNGKFQHSYAGLPRVPENGAYTYRTNPNPETDPWIITGAMKVNRLLTPSEVDEMVSGAGREPQPRQEGAATDAEIKALNEQLGLETPLYSLREKDASKGSIRYRSKAPMSLEEKKRQTEEDFGGIWIEDREEYAKFASVTVSNPFEQNGEGLVFTSDYLYAYYRNYKGEAIPYISVLVLTDESPAIVEQVKRDIKYGNKRAKRDIDTALERLRSAADTSSDIDGGDFDLPLATGNGEVGSYILRKGRYAYTPELFRKGRRAYRTKAEYTDSQRVIATQAQTLSTAEIEEYINEVAKSLPEGVKVVVTNSTESGDREHSGWYDMGTDTVYINTDMCDNTADVDATIVHELVGHRSMPTAIARVIGRTNATDRIALYTKLATMLPKELLDRVMAKTAADMDLGVAVDEVLAEAVENADLIKPSVWQRICSEVRAFFRRVFNRGISLSDGDIKYMFWLSANSIGEAAEYRAEGILHRLGAGRFKRNSALPTEEQQEYDSAVISKSQQFVEEWVDSLNPLKKLQETVAKHHGELKSWENAYDIELGRASRTMARFNMMSERFLKPLITAISAFTNNGISREEVMNYMIAKHGLERNEYARRQAHQELNKSILDAVKEVATSEEYAGLSDVEKASVVKSMFADYLDHLDSDEIVRALEFFASSPDTDFIGIVVALEAVPLEDVSGLTGLAEKLSDDPDAKPEEIFTEFAESLVEKFEGENEEAVNTLWDKVRDLSNATLLYQTEGGILSQEQYQHLRSMYRYYIPLRGWDGPNSRDYYEYSTSPARFQTVVKAAKGRKSLAEDPLANMANMLQSAVTIVEKNASKQAFVRMALNRSDSSVVRVVKVRYEKRKNASTGKTEWVAVFPDFNQDASSAEIDAAIAGFDEQTKQLVAEGEARVRRSQVDVGVKVLPANLNDHYVKAMINGEEVAVIVNGSPAAALALNGTNVPSYDEALQDTIGKATRFFARTHTTWAPKFVVTNFLRDYGYGSLTALTRYGTKYAMSFQKNIARSMWLLPKMLKNGISQLSEEQLEDFSKIDRQTLRYFVEFLTNGGETGFTQSLSTEEWKKEIEKQIKALNGKDTKNAVKALLSLLDSANRYVEDIPRFAAYLTSRESGKNISDSIKDAKEITVNFSRHGAGGMGNSLVRKSYAFVNAGVQGLYNLTALAKEHPERFYPTMATIFLTGFGLPFLNILLISAFGDDDDERNYKYMSEFNNTNRLVLFNPFGKEKGFITLPISHELVPFYGLGNIFSRRLMGYDADISLSGQIATTIMSAMPLDFISVSAQGVSLRSFIPSVAQPIYDVFQNRDFMGRPIYRSYDFGNGNSNRGDAAFTKAPIDTWEWLVWLSKQTSRLTGGDGIIMQGLSDFHISDKDADVQISNPAIAQYLLESYLGGALQSASKVVNLGKGLVAKMTGDETRAEEYLAAYNLPLISGLYRFSNETSANGRIKEAYDHYKNDISKQCERAVKTYMEELPSDLNLWPKAAIDVLNSTDYQIYQLFKDYDKPIRKAEKLLNEAYDRKAPKAEIDELKRVIMAAKMELIEAASDIQLRGVATKMQDNN